MSNFRNKWLNQKPSLGHVNQRGMTLVELLVAMAISLFLLIAIALVYSSSKNGFVYANNTVRMSEDASFAVDSLSRDIRMAAYGGCAGTVIARTAGADSVLYTADDVIDHPYSSATTKSTPNIFNVSPPTLAASGYEPVSPFSALALTANNAVVGFPSGTGTAANAARTQLHSAAPTDYTVSTTAPMLYLAGGSARAFQVNGPVAAGSSITLGGSPYAGPSFTASTFMLISDCNTSEVFRVGADTSNGVISTNNPLLNNYGADAVVTTLQSSTYFLAKRSGANNSSLYRRFFNGSTRTFEEVIPNVEAVTFQYGENTSFIAAGPNAGQPSYVADVYRTDASTVTDWSRVVSVRIGMIMVSEEGNQAPTTDGIIKWVGGDYTPNSTTDNRLRRAYSTTVSIRNRMGL